MKLNPLTNQAFQLLMQGSQALARAEMQGIRIDLEYSERKKEELTKKINNLEKAFKETAFYRHWQHSRGNKVPNIHSNSQLSTFLYKVKKLEITVFSESGQGATDEDALTQLGIPELNDLLQIRKLKKIRDTYLESFVREQVNGFIHPSFNLHLVRSYRSSSNSPNFQNIPARDEEAMNICRGALFPREGNQLMEVDFRSIEVGINACINKDSTLVKYVSDPTTDMHRDMAIQLFLIDNFNKKDEAHALLRQAAKNGFVFPEFYGDYWKNCAANLACNWGKLSKGKWSKSQGVAMATGNLSDHLISKGIKEFGEIKNTGYSTVTTGFLKHIQKIEDDFWGNRFKEYAQWKEKNWKSYQKNGYIDFPTGFRCVGLMNKKEANNYPGQGSAFHCLLWSFIEADRIMRLEKWDTKIIGQIHDSVVLDVNPKEKDHVIESMRRITCQDLPNAWKWIFIPLQVEIKLGKINGSWADMEKA